MELGHSSSTARRTTQGDSLSPENGMKKKKKKPTRARTLQRAGRRSDAKLVAMREQLAKLEPGGSEDTPISVESASVIEPRAESFRCLRCEESMRCTSHTSRTNAAGDASRVAELTCRACGAKRVLYFRVEQRLPN
jgi:hypothetical protein